MRLCLIPHSFIYSLQTDDLNCGPLSVLISFGKPNSENILSTTGITDSTVVFLKISTTGYLEYSSCITIRVSPDGSGPQKSRLSFFQGPEGRLDIDKGSMLVLFVFAWHGIQPLTTDSALVVMFGNHTLDLSKAFVLWIP